MKNSSLAANKGGKIGLNLFTKLCLREYLLSDLSGNCLEKSYLYSLSSFELTHSSFRRKTISPGCLSEIISSNYLKLHLLEAVKQGWANMLKKSRKSGKWEVHRGLCNLPIYSWEYRWSLACPMLWTWPWKTSEGLISQLGNLTALSKKEVQTKAVVISARDMKMCPLTFTKQRWGHSISSRHLRKFLFSH